MGKTLILLAALLVAGCTAGDTLIELAAEGPGPDQDGELPVPAASPDPTDLSEHADEIDRWPEPLPLPTETPMDVEPSPMDVAIAQAALAAAPEELRPTSQPGREDYRLVFQAEGGGTVTVIGRSLTPAEREASEQSLSAYGQPLEDANASTVLVEQHSGDVVTQMYVLVGAFEFNVAAMSASVGEPIPLTEAELERYAMAIAAQLR